MLEMKHIYKYYNPGTVNEMCLFQDLNLTVEDGEFVAIVGSNGSGKLEERCRRRTYNSSCRRERKKRRCRFR